VLNRLAPFGPMAWMLWRVPAYTRIGRVPQMVMPRLSTEPAIELLTVEVQPGRLQGDEGLCCQIGQGVGLVSGFLGIAGGGHGTPELGRYPGVQILATVGAALAELVVAGSPPGGGIFLQRAAGQRQPVGLQEFRRLLVAQSRQAGSRAGSLGRSP
jgi:uncharacterized membrane protein YfcA